MQTSLNLLGKFFYSFFRSPFLSLYISTQTGKTLEEMTAFYLIDVISRSTLVSQSYGWRDLNPQPKDLGADFKSAASARSATGAHHVQGEIRTHISDETGF